MAAMSLVSLPKEVIRQICSYLPCGSALRFTFVCRFIYQTCDDWPVWRTVTTRSGGYISSLSTLISGDRNAWKQYVVAAAKAEVNFGNWTLGDLDEWLPQVAALCHPAVLEGQTSSLMQLYGLTLHDPALAQFCESSLSGESRDFEKLSIHAWQRAQAASFSASVHYLSLQAPGEECGPLACTVPWLPTSSLDPDQSDKEELKKLATIQHALANRIVGFLGARLRLCRAAIPRGVGLYDPPSATTIPFFNMMRLPVPFAEEGLETFCQCHLPTMNDPKFFTDGPWTGTTGLLRTYPENDPTFISIGGIHSDGFDRPDLPAPPGSYPNGRAFEGVVRFKLIREDDASYTLQSNNFHSEADLHRIRLDVDKTTGQLTMHHWHRFDAWLGRELPKTDGVITPFGIVTHINAPGSLGLWMWLWKVEWSADIYEEEPGARCSCLFYESLE